MKNWLVGSLLFMICMISIACTTTDFKESSEILIIENAQGEVINKVTNSEDLKAVYELLDGLVWSRGNVTWLGEPDYIFYFESSEENVDTSRYEARITRDGLRLELGNLGEQKYMSLVKFKSDILFPILSGE